MPLLTEQPAPSAIAARTDSDLPQQHYRYVLTAIVLVAAVLRFWNLGARGFWFDEGYSWGMTRLPWPLFFHWICTRAADMTAYYTLAKLWTIFGTSEFAMRSLSAVVSVATVPVVAELGRRLYSRKAGILAAAMFAVHVFVIHFAQEARTYPLVMFFVALGWLQLTNVVREPSRRNWFLFSLLALAQVYAHFLAGFNVAAQFLTLLFLSPKKLGWSGILRSVGTITVGMLPALAYTLLHQGDLSWARPTGFGILREFADSVTGRSQSSVHICVFGVLFLVVFVRSIAVWRSKGIGYELWAASIPVVGFVVPVLALLVISLRQPVFIPRYLAFTVLPLLLGVAWLCSRLTAKWYALGSVILIAALARPLPAFYRAATWNDYYNTVSWDDFRDTVQYISLRQQPGDAIMVWIPMARPAVDYYGTRQPSFPDYLYPNGHIPLQEDMVAPPDPYTLPGMVARRNRIWIIYTLRVEPERSGLVAPLYLQRIVEREHKLVSEHQYRTVRVEEYALK